MAKSHSALGGLQMEKYGKIAVAMTAVALSAGLTASAHASAVKGYLWVDQPTAAEDATIANIPATPADVTFSAPSDPLYFFSGYGTTNPVGGPSGAYTVGGFLGIGNATILSGSSYLGDDLDNTFIEFTGTVTVTNGETFTAGHDDGLQLLIGTDLVIDAPGGTSYATTTETYTGPSGNLPFTLTYGEAYGAPAALYVNLPLTSAIPETPTWAMMLAGFAGLGFAGRRASRKRAAVEA
jgi:hypothetical protein